MVGYEYMTIGAWWSSEHRPTTAKIFGWDMPRNSVAWSKNSDTSSQLPQAFVPIVCVVTIRIYVSMYTLHYTTLHTRTHACTYTHIHTCTHTTHVHTQSNNLHGVHYRIIQSNRHHYLSNHYHISNTYHVTVVQHNATVPAATTDHHGN